ncbi:DUF1211 domain-containing protein [Mucilaginibacter mali]|uniref:DUF1211 domain-containing protein n=1 Tax=Mucilaginibacter mali TaxID=2740462 RepID=A0A7D4PT38_9SPHI|nr:TMEM175 family protein [Mucilaginibacter mali]QKJ29608.1 DUF1211 domain-containing protein [Mucilaginibacter mali]
MNLEEEQEIKKEFQLERVILFSDAVFAIIITIMVIELKFPETIKEMKLHSPELHHAIAEVVLKFTGYLVSFFIVARFWMTHLKIFSFLKDYNNKLLMLNLAFLFCVSLFPFGVTLITGTFKPGSVQYGWGMTTYITIFFAGTLTQSLLIRYLVLNKNTLCVAPDKIENELRWKSTKFMIGSLGFFFLVLILANYFELPPLLYIYIMAFFGVVNGVVVRKLYPNEATSDSKPVILRIFSRKKASPKA